MREKEEKMLAAKSTSTTGSLEEHLRHMTSLGEFLAEKEEINISDTNEDETNVAMTSEAAAVDRSSQIRLKKYMKKLIERDDFRFYFYHNQAIKQGVLSAVAALVKEETHNDNKLKALHLLDDLIGAEIDLNGAHFLILAETVRSIYNSFYISIINDIEVIINEMSTTTGTRDKRYVKFKSFLKHLCFMLACMQPGNLHVSNEAAPVLVKLAHLTREYMSMFPPLFLITLFSIILNRHPNDRNKTINGDLRSSDENNNTSLSEDALYSRVLFILDGLKRVIENEFEIEIVIYFYTIIIPKLDELSELEADEVATKLMEILTKIEDMSRRDEDRFMPHQVAHIYEFSLKLIIASIKIFKQDFCDINWKFFDKKWTKSILTWEPLAYKAISTLCDYTDLGSNNFGCIRKLGQRVRNSWLGDPSSSYEDARPCQGPFKAKKELGMFLDPEILHCVVKLLIKYDEGILAGIWNMEAFVDDLRPVFEIIGELFGSIGYRDKMLKCLCFFTFFPSLKSPSLRSQSVWTKHIDLLIYHIVQVTHENTVYDLNKQLIEAVIKISRILVSEFDVLIDFRHVMVDAVAFANRKSRLRPLGSETEKDLEKIRSILEQ